jgi:hypothetical protein
VFLGPGRYEIEVKKERSEGEVVDQEDVDDGDDKGGTHAVFKMEARNTNRKEKKRRRTERNHCDSSSVVR